MKQSPYKVILVLLILVGVVSFTGMAHAVGIFSQPLIYDWLNNDTNDEGSHVSDYGISMPERYFSGGLAGPQNLEDRLNETPNLATIYRVYDESFNRYPTEPVYDKWNENNAYDYHKRNYVPEFKKEQTKSESGDSSLGLGSDERLIDDGWTGIYSIQPSVYAHYKQENPSDEDSYTDVSRHLVGDSADIIAIVSADQVTVPDTRVSGTGVGARRYSYSLEKFNLVAVAYIEGSSKCPGRCPLGTTTVTQNVARFNDLNLEKWVSPGDQFKIVVQGTATVGLNENVERQVEDLVQVPCPEDESESSNTTDNETTNQKEICRESRLEWVDSDENTITESVRMTDSQTVTYPKGLNSEDVNDDVVYERGVYPNGTTELHVDTSGLEGTVTGAGVWQRIEIGDEYVASNWRAWSSRNMSWDYMYPTSDSRDRHLSHTRPLVFHTAPLDAGLTSSQGLKYSRVGNNYDITAHFRRTDLFGDVETYSSPVLLRHKSCKQLYPEHNENPDRVFCGWWLTGTGNTITSQRTPPYLSLETDGQWAAYNDIYVTAPDSAEYTRTLDMYGLVPGQKTEITPDRDVDVQKSKIYVEVLDDNFDDTDAEHSWIKTRITLVNTETNERIDTSDRRNEILVVKNAQIDEDGNYSSEIVNTNSSGQVTLKIYNPKRNNINVEYDARNWEEVPEDEQAYTDATYTEDVVVPAVSMIGFLRYFIGIGGLIYMVVAVMVKFMQILGYNTTTQKELEKFFPQDMKSILIGVIILFFVLSLL